jgi:hypothetical protein
MVEVLKVFTGNNLKQEVRDINGKLIVRKANHGWSLADPNHEFQKIAKESIWSCDNNASAEDIAKEMNRRIGE